MDGSAKRNLYLVGWLSLLTDLSSQMIFPLLPFYLTLSLGATPLVVSAMEGAAESLAAFLKLYAGKWSDRTQRRKPWIVSGYGISALAKIFFALAQSWPLIFSARLFERVGKGLRSAPRDALVADSVPKELHGRAFGFQRAMDGAGGVLGAVLALALIQVMPFSDVFLIAVVPALMAAILTVALKEAPASARSSKTAKPAVAVSLKLPQFLIGFGILGNLSFALILLACYQQGASLSVSLLGYIGFQLLYTAASPIIGRLSDRHGHVSMVRVSALSYAAGYLALAGLPGYLGLVVGVGAYALAEAAGDTSKRAWFASLCAPEARGSAMGVYHATVAALALPAGILWGWVWLKLGASVALTLACLIALAHYLLIRAFAPNHPVSQS
jgi:MFS family permease